MTIYVRFVCAQKHPTADAELGMFSARDQIDFAVLPGRVQRAHDEAWFWFSRGGGGGLMYPRLRSQVRTPKIQQSLFWFKSEAAFYGYPKGSIVRRARELADALSAAGVEIRELNTTDPGEIIWKDLDQVLAWPDGRDIPRAFG